MHPPLPTDGAPTGGHSDSSGGLELIDKVDAVLTALEQHGEMTAADLAHTLGEPLSSTYRMLQSLTAIAWVDRSPRRGHYRLGVGLMTIGGLVEDNIDVRDVARPALITLHDQTHATSFLCVRRGARAVCIERVEGRAVRSLAMQLGSSLPLYVGGAPLALLAFLPRSEQRDLAAQPQLPGDPPMPEPAALESELAAIRERGFAISDEDVTPGIAALGAPIFNHRHELVGSISFSGLREQILGANLATNRELLLEAARATSMALGDDRDR